MSQPSPELLYVSSEEDGIRLLRFLERRLAPPPPASLLYKWIRTGQIRVNKGRVKASAVLKTGDAVRLPPFAIPREVAPLPAGTTNLPQPKQSPPLLGADLPILSLENGLMVLVKPAGLPVQGGTGHSDTVCARLRQAYAKAAFIPAPAHRLDRATSGLLLVGCTLAVLRQLHSLFSNPGGVTKEYLAWVVGNWPYPGPHLLVDTLGKQAFAKGERVWVQSLGQTIPYTQKKAQAPNGAEPTSHIPAHLEEAKHKGQALAVATAVYQAHTPLAGVKTATLLHVRLLTGRTHQIRVQLASRGFPIIGDTKYNGPAFPCLLLHAGSISLPGHGSYVVMPGWEGWYKAPEYVFSPSGSN